MGGFLEPNIHPVIVHFGYALIVTAWVAHLLGRWRASLQQGENLKTTGDWMLAFGTLAILATAASGLWAYYTVAHDGPSHEAMTVHRNWALPTAAAVLALGFWRYTKRVMQPGFAYLTASSIVVLSLSVTAWFGGHVVYGHGIGVQRLPVVTGDGHDHEHGPGADHASMEAEPSVASALAETTPAPLDQSDHHAGTAAPEHAHDAPAGSGAVPHGHDNSDGHHDVPMGQSESGELGAVSDALASALRKGEADAVRGLFNDGAVIAEGGKTELGLDAYASHHLERDMAFLADTRRQVLERNVVRGEDVAVVVTRSETVGRYKGESVHERTVETLTLERTSQGWKIAAVHWSSAPLDGDHEH